MRKRSFKFRSIAVAHAHMLILLQGGISFQVFCHVDGVHIETPFELAEQDFPKPEWLQ